INFKSRSPLSMREKRRITYNFAARIAPSFTQQIPLREERRVHALGSLSYTEVFDAFGGARNLGVVVNLFNSETALGWFTTQRDFQNTTTQPAYVWDYRTGDVYNHRRQKNINTKIDYRLSPSTKLSFLAAYIDHSEVYRRQYDTRAYTGSQNQNTVPNATTTSIAPGFTDRVTTVRPVATSTIDITMTGPNNFFNRLRRVDLGAEHKWGPWEIDYNARYTQTHINIGNGEGGVLVNRLTGAGWILDRTQSDLFPKFTQTGGADFTNPANFRPTTYTNNTQGQDNYNKEARANFKYSLRAAQPTFLKAGGLWRKQLVGQFNDARRWTFIGTSGIPSDPTLLSYDTVKTGRRIPQWENLQHFSNRTPANPSIWREDLYFHEQVEYTGNRAATEEITAGYLMGQGRVGSRFGWIAGVRTERTETGSWGWVRARTPSSAAQQTADPAGSAARDYANNLRTLSGSYTKSFPSIHGTFDVTSNLKARLSWSTGFGRPALMTALPNETVNETNGTLTIGNPGLRPQMAENLDASLEYYFEPVGTVSVGWFQKDIKDFIASGVALGTIASGNDNGFNGEYAGLTILSTANAGKAHVKGWEFTYQQQFTFLPGILRGLGASANYTVISANGDFGNTGLLTTNEVDGFIPKTGNASLSWRYKKFSTRVLYNFTSDYIVTYSSASAGRNLYRYGLKTYTAGVAYQYRPSLAFTIDVANLTNEPQRQYRGNPDQMERTIINGTTITFGVNGRF
ncbi:MAG TPA: TonB-dependent receptor, partial [Opitutaceae bacterium]